MGENIVKFHYSKNNQSKKFDFTEENKTCVYYGKWPERIQLEFYFETQRFYFFVINSQVMFTKLFPDYCSLQVFFLTNICYNLNFFLC